MAKINEFYRTREDGVNLYLNIDALIDENGKVVRDEDGHPVPRGFYIKQNETQIFYTEAIDVENAPYTYSETDIPIEDFTTEEPSPEEELMNNELQ